MLFVKIVILKNDNFNAAPVIIGDITTVRLFFRVEQHFITFVCANSRYV